MILYNAIGGAGDLLRYIEWQDARQRRGGNPAENRPLNVLISFQYIAGSYNIIKNLRSTGRIASLFLDAGTFTLNEGKRGKGPKPLTRFNEYLHYVSMYHEIFDKIAAYDEDFDSVAINNELLAALQRRLSQASSNRPGMSDSEIKAKIVPTLHSVGRAAVEDFQEYASDGYRNIAVGSRPQIEPEIWREIRDIAVRHGNISIHHFGSLSPTMLMKRRPDSADSTGFLKSGAFGSVSWWKPGIGSIDAFVTYDLLPNTNTMRSGKGSKQKVLPTEYEDYLTQTFGWDGNDLREDTSKRAAVNLHAIMEMESWLNSGQGSTVQ